MIHKNILLRICLGFFLFLSIVFVIQHTPLFAQADNEGQPVTNPPAVINPPPPALPEPIPAPFPNLNSCTPGTEGCDGPVETQPPVNPCPFTTCDADPNNPAPTPEVPPPTDPNGPSIDKGNKCGYAEFTGQCYCDEKLAYPESCVSGQQPLSGCGFADSGDQNNPYCYCDGQKQVDNKGSNNYSRCDAVSPPADGFQPPTSGGNGTPPGSTCSQSSTNDYNIIYNCTDSSGNFTGQKMCRKDDPNNCTFTSNPQGGVGGQNTCVKGEGIAIGAAVGAPIGTCTTAAGCGGHRYNEWVRGCTTEDQCPGGSICQASICIADTASCDKASQNKQTAVPTPPAAGTTCDSTQGEKIPVDTCSGLDCANGKCYVECVNNQVRGACKSTTTSPQPDPNRIGEDIACQGKADGPTDSSCTVPCDGKDPKNGIYSGRNVCQNGVLSSCAPDASTKSATCLANGQTPNTQDTAGKKPGDPAGPNGGTCDIKCENGTANVCRGHTYVVWRPEEQGGNYVGPCMCETASGTCMVGGKDITKPGNGGTSDTSGGKNGGTNPGGTNPSQASQSANPASPAQQTCEKSNDAKCSACILQNRPGITAQYQNNPSAINGLDPTTCDGKNAAVADWCSNVDAAACNQLKNDPQTCQNSCNSAIACEQSAQGQCATCIMTQRQDVWNNAGGPVDCQEKITAMNNWCQEATLGKTQCQGVKADATKCKNDCAGLSDTCRTYQDKASCDAHSSTCKYFSCSNQCWQKNTANTIACPSVSPGATGQYSLTGRVLSSGPQQNGQNGVINQPNQNFNNGGVGVPGATVTLTTVNQNLVGTAVNTSTTKTATTDNTGTYVFRNLAAGSYTVQITQVPAGYTLPQYQQQVVPIQIANGNVVQDFTVAPANNANPYNLPPGYPTLPPNWRPGQPLPSGYPSLVPPNPYNVPSGYPTLPPNWKPGDPLPSNYPTLPPTNGTLTPAQGNGSITGMVYIDTNKNGVYDNGELTSPNVILTLAGPVTATVTTTQTGSYTFSNLPLGTYQVSITNQSTTTSASVSVTLSTTSPTATANFGINSTNLTITPSGSPAPGSGTISGVVYNDLNKNGVQDTNEQGYPNATISLQGTQTATTTTSQSGSYTFSNLLQGLYGVSITLPSGYQATTTGSSIVTLGTNATVNFGIVSNQITITPTLTITPTASPTATLTPTPRLTVTPTPTLTVTPTPSLFNVTGTVYIDINRNGVQDSNEPNYQNAQINLVGTQSKSTSTNASGTYTFSSLPTGGYAVIITLPSGYQSTTATTRQITLGPTSTVNFGIIPNSALSGTPVPTVPPVTPTPTIHAALPSFLSTTQLYSVILKM